MNCVLLSNEVEMYIDSMHPQHIKNIGSLQWIEWHQRLQKLNQEALLEASQVKEEQVKESLVSFGKVKVLIHEAILINIWKHKILPLLLKLESNPKSSILAYSILYHEGVCVALLELVMYHTNCCESLEDAAADLLDYLCGTVSQLLLVKYKENIGRETTKDELLRHMNNLSFDIGIRSLTIIRYLAENLERLPFNITTRVYSSLDIPVLFTQILLAQPWSSGGKLYQNGQWKNWNSEQLGQAEAQVWLALRQLLLDPEATKRYEISDSRRTQLSKLLPRITPTLLDQLSPLIELKHWLCRLSVMEQPAVNANPILLEPVLEIKAAIMEQAAGKWRRIAEKQLTLIFNDDNNALQDTARKLTEAYNTELLETLEGNESSITDICAECGKNAIQRCSRCKKIWYCSRACQVAHWPQHKDNC